jgi:Xaa-Pro aminopeptidase
MDDVEKAAATGGGQRRRRLIAGLPYSSEVEHMSARVQALRRSLPDAGVDTILIAQPENRRYLSGFTGSAGYLFISADAARLATDSRYYEQVQRQAPDFELVRIERRFIDLLPDLLADLGTTRLGFEAAHVTVDQYDTWRDAAGEVAWVPLKETVENLRVVKDRTEIEAIRRSAALTDAAFAHLVEVIAPGMAERQAAWEMEAFMREHGASKVAFDLIVAAGPNGAMAHHRPGDRIIAEGDPIVIDIGCVVDGYCSDMTRTVCLGKPRPKYLDVWQIVLDAQETAEEAIRAGVTGVEADAAARDVIVEAGYGDYFGHGLGHGVGLAVHEAPRASRLSGDTLEAGMTVTVEPGIYLPGEFGVRIEDLVVVRDGGVEVLSQTAKKPVLL